MIPLDAEAPAEGGIGEAYRTNVLPRRRRFLDGQRPIADVIVLFTIVNDQLPWPHTPVLRDQRRQRPRRSVSHA